MTFKMLKKPKEDNNIELESVKKKQDVLTKARNKLFNLSESLKSSKNLTVPKNPKKGIPKSKTQVNLDHFYKPAPGKNQLYYSSVYQRKEKPTQLQKQNSIGSYPIRIEVTNENDELIHNSRQNLCVNKLEAPLDTEALALEKPRKKLSFRVPEIIGTFGDNKLGFGNLKNNDKSGSYRNIRAIIEKASATPQTLIRNASFNGILERQESFENSELESQAMRVVRTVGQAFEVCHKLSINNPENEHLDQDEQDTLTQDLLSDRLSDITSDKPKRDILSEGASDRMSLPPDDCSFKDLDTSKIIRTTGQLDILPPPPNSNINVRSNIILSSAEMYSSPHSDGLTTGSGESGSSLPPPGTALSTHHELQLMRQQLEQQTQQTQAALAQLQLAREQLAAEQGARLEAQARTHQLLIHNRELLDHIAALVGHLQGSEKSGQQSTPPHMTMPQQNQNDSSSETYEYADGPLHNKVNFNIPENINSASFLPSSPLRTSFNPGGNIFNFPYQQSLEASLENQLFQKLQALNNPYQYQYSQSLPFLLQNLYTPPMTNMTNSFTLPHNPQKNIYFNKSFGNGRHSEPRQLNPNCFNQSPPSKREDYYTLQQTQPKRDTYQPTESDSPIYQKIIPKKDPESEQKESSSNPLYQTIIPKKQRTDDNKRLKIQTNEHIKREASPQPQIQPGSHFIKPHSQIGTLMTTDPDGRLRVVVPVLSNSKNDLSESFSNLSTDDKYKPSMSRSVSEKFGNNDTNLRENTLGRHKSK